MRGGEPRFKTRAQRKRHRAVCPQAAAHIVLRRLLWQAAAPHETTPLDVAVTMGAASQILRKRSLPRALGRRLRAALAAVDPAVVEAARRVLGDAGAPGGLAHGDTLTVSQDGGPAKLVDFGAALGGFCPAPDAEKAAEILRQAGFDAQASGRTGVTVKQTVRVPEPADYITIPLSIGDSDEP